MGDRPGALIRRAVRPVLAQRPQALTDTCRAKTVHVPAATCHCEFHIVRRPTFLNETVIASSTSSGGRPPWMKLSLRGASATRQSRAKALDCRDCLVAFASRNDKWPPANTP